MKQKRGHIKLKKMKVKLNVSWPGDLEAYCRNANQMFQSIQWVCIHVSCGVGGKEKVIKVSGPAAAWHDEMCFNKEKKKTEKWLRLRHRACGHDLNSKVKKRVRDIVGL